MSTTVGGLASRALARLGGLDKTTSPEPVWSHDGLVAYLRKTGVADAYICCRAEAENAEPESPEDAVSMATLGNTALILMLGLEVPFMAVQEALKEIWDDVEQSSDPWTSVLVAAEGVVQRLKDRRTPPEMIEMMRQSITRNTKGP
jgi:hypothetical protein